MVYFYVLRRALGLAGVAPNRVGASLGAYKTAQSLPAQKRVKKRKGPDGTSLDRVSQSSKCPTVAFLLTALIELCALDGARQARVTLTSAHWSVDMTVTVCSYTHAV